MQFIGYQLDLLQRPSEVNKHKCLKSLRLPKLLNYKTAWKAWGCESCLISVLWFAWALLGLTGPYWALLGLIGPNFEFVDWLTDPPSIHPCWADWYLLWPHSSADAAAAPGSPQRSPELILFATRRRWTRPWKPSSCCRSWRIQPAK